MSNVYYKTTGDLNKVPTEADHKKNGVEVQDT